MARELDRDHWTAAFLLRHSQAVPANWPDHPAYFAVFQAAMIEADVAEEEADAASFEMGKNPPPYVDQQLKTFLAIVRRRRGEQAAAARERAIAHSIRRNDDDAYEREVAAVWESMDPAARDEWRALVRRLLRFPSLATSPRTLDMFAAVWAHDPALVPGEPETPAASAPRKPGEPKPLGEIL